MTTRKVIIFTDLDGTLLDPKTYSYEPAEHGLELIREKNIPLILSSSKTRAEIEVYRDQMRNDHPFISENGGAIFVPKEYFSFSFPHDREVEGYFVLELGVFYPRIVEILNSIKKETGISIKGFSDLTEKEMISLSGLRPKEAGLAKQREYDEPFVIEGGEKEVEIIRRKIEEKEMNYTSGGRFHHLLGNNDKGKAVQILKKLYESQFSQILTAGIGDSLNDLPMLLAVDYPIFLKEEGVPQLKMEAPISNLVIIDGAGPRAWNRAVMEFLGAVP
ncbi:MAG: mannosyl-3-phosphoglycerate phosphatase [Thermodesulfobacteriota bacterium]